jgi:hypothetical protein
MAALLSRNSSILPEIMQKMQLKGGGNNKTAKNKAVS